MAKQYLAIFLGTVAAREQWMALEGGIRKEQEKAGMEAWMKWMDAHKKSIADKGSPLGKTLRVDAKGISPVRNELGAWAVVQAESQEEAAKIFEHHPHFMIFPGEAVEVMECLPIPKL